MTNYPLELIAAGLRSDDPNLTVVEQNPRSWLNPDLETAYVDVREADVQPDGRVRVTALVTRLAGAEPLGIEVPQNFQPAVAAGTTGWKNSRPVHAYVPGATLWQWTVAGNVGHSARSRVEAEGWLAAAQTEFPDGEARVKSLRSALLDIAAQSPLPAERPEQKVFHGATWAALVKATSSDDYEVTVFAQERSDGRGAVRNIHGKLIDDTPQYFVTADEAVIWLSPWVEQLAVPDCGTLSGVATNSNGLHVTLSFRRPTSEEN